MLMKQLKDPLALFNIDAGGPRFDDVLTHGVKHILHERAPKHFSHMLVIRSRAKVLEQSMLWLSNRIGLCSYLPGIVHTLVRRRV